MIKTPLPRLKADLLLLHAPAVFDFRDRRDIYFPFLSNAGDVPATPLYEYFPVGFKTLQRYLGDRGHDVKLLNLSTVLLRYPKLDFDMLVRAFDVRLIGIDLHWMVHVQGSLAVAERIKKIQDIPIIFGGISSTYYADELIQYPFIDMVMLGYDTHEPMDHLLNTLKNGGGFRSIANLAWKSTEGIEQNDFSHKPATFSCGIDWSSPPPAPKNLTLPILEVLSTQNAGCAYNCGWCGGSRDAFRRIFKRKRTIARKTFEEIDYEFETLKQLPGIDRYHFYAVGSYNESRKGMAFFLDQVARSEFKSINYEQFRLPTDDVVKRMVEANKFTSITLSPESHNYRIAKLAGRGTYTNEEMESWLERALEYGIYQIDIWYFVGMPEQDERSVMETVDYCHHLLRKFRGSRVNPMICPMVPFLDPASNYFEQPEEHGYRVFYRTVEEHRRGMERASLINRTNYETKWLSRGDLTRVGYRAMTRLMEAKADVGFLPTTLINEFNAKLADALEFIDEVHRVDNIEDQRVRALELDKLGDEILRRNNMVFSSQVLNQSFPVNRGIGGRWFDEMGWEPDVLEATHGALNLVPEAVI